MGTFNLLRDLETLKEEGLREKSFHLLVYPSDWQREGKHMNQAEGIKERARVVPSLRLCHRLRMCMCECVILAVSCVLCFMHV